MLPKCQDCGKVHFYPRVFCPHCHSHNLTWVQASGKGKLYSFEILYRPFNRAVKVPPPYVLAMVELEEGPRMLSNLVNVEPDPKVVQVRHARGNCLCKTHGRRHDSAVPTGTLAKG